MHLWHTFAFTLTFKVFAPLLCHRCQIQDEQKAATDWLPIHAQKPFSSLPCFAAGVISPPPLQGKGGTEGSRRLNPPTVYWVWGFGSESNRKFSRKKCAQFSFSLYQPPNPLTPPTISGARRYWLHPLFFSPSTSGKSSLFSLLFWGGWSILSESTGSSTESSLSTFPSSSLHFPPNSPSHPSWD